jgi:hypothetical protein
LRLCERLLLLLPFTVVATGLAITFRTTGVVRAGLLQAVG